MNLQEIRRTSSLQSGLSSAGLSTCQTKGKELFLTSSGGDLAGIVGNTSYIRDMHW